MKHEPMAMSTQPCAKCAAVLDTSGTTPGTWLSCPSCGQPVQVRAKPFLRPNVEPAPEEPLGVAWSSDPRLNERPKPPSKPPVLEDLPSTFPEVRLERRAGMLQILMLAGLAGVAQAMFVGSFLMVANPWELLLSGAFGALVAGFVAVMVNTMRWGGSEERRGPL